MERAPRHGPFAGVEPGQAELAISRLNAALRCIGLPEEQAVAARNVHRFANSPSQPMAFRSTTEELTAGSSAGAATIVKQKQEMVLAADV